MTANVTMQPSDGAKTSGRRSNAAKLTPRSSSYSSGMSSASTAKELQKVDDIDTPSTSSLFQSHALQADFDQPRVWRARPVHHRRASQPVSNSMLRQRLRSVNTATSDEGSSTALDEPYSSGNSSCEEDDGSLEKFRPGSGRLDYLDLSISMPYALISLRDHLLAYTSQLEERVRSLYSFPPHGAEGAEIEHTSQQNDSSNAQAVFYSHLEALKEELRSLINALPSPSSAAAPLFPGRASAALEAGRQSLASDWERLSKSLHTTLAMRPDAPLPDMTSFAALLAPLTSALPSPHAGSILVSVQRRFETLQESVRALTLRHMFFTAKREDEISAVDLASRRSRSGSFAASQQALAKQFESILDSVKLKGEEVRLAGHARASSMVKAAREAEERVYAKAVELARNGQLLIRYEHLPELWRNNEHILSGYRFIPKEEWSSLLRSTFQVHNETGNIMTHLIGAIVVAPLFWPAKDRFDDQTTPMDRMVQTIYLVAALKCLLLSVSWHVMAGCSDACLFERFACVDYTGIAWLVAASVWTLVYNAFYCQPNLAMVYSLSTFVVGLVGAIVPWQAWFNERQNKPIRIAVFLAMCFTGLAPFTHAVLSHGLFKTHEFFGAILPSLFAYVFGLVFYAFQVPECFFPGRFDVVGHAHQIWHISIVVAIILHYRATFYWHENRFNFSCALPGHAQSSHSSLITNPLAVDLNLADDVVHGWRILAGQIGDGLVGRMWDRCVDTLMATF